jgi:hypothetical protein
MGFSPVEVDQMSMWQFLITVEGWAEAHAKDESGMSPKEADEIWQWLQSKPLPAKANGVMKNGR